MLPRILTRVSAIRPIVRQATVAPRAFTTSSVALKHKESADREFSHFLQLVSLPCAHESAMAFHCSPSQFSLTRFLCESAASSSQYDPEKHKQDSLSKQKSGKGHWKPELASDSEEAVKADRSGKEDMSKLQERTKAAAEESSKSGTSMRDGL